MSVKTKTKFPPITAVIFEDPEAWLREHVDDMTVDNVASVHRLTKFHPDGLTKYRDFDAEGQPVVERTMEDHINALWELCRLIDQQKLHVGCLRSASQLVDPCNWDVEVYDAFYQLVFRMEVIYG